ncbi:MAG: carboxylesterase family protein [Lachnospiraceae bacterium]|nr:carboxylesterase family protein [Lachnospiraceae bacterium]
MTDKKRAGAFFCISTVFVFLIMLAVLELSKNIVAGYILTVFVTCAYIFVYIKILGGKKGFFRFLAWLGWLAAFVLVLYITRPPVRAVPAVDYSNPEKTKVVTVSDGMLQGVVTEDGEVEVYAGIPYAKPPVGELRWKEPQAPDKWEGVLLADHFAPMSMQPSNLPIYNSLAQIIGYHDYRISLKDNYIPPVSEDSLYLNIWKPAGEVSDLPVLVYIHGGSLQTGQPWYEDYSGKGLADDGIIVVNMGYRLGVFGFYADEELISESENGTTGNYGLLDQIKALEWVRDNIAAFGGDPDNVTVSGESAGSACVSALCTSPLARGLFNRVIMESSTVAAVEPTHSFRLLDEALESGAELKERYGCGTVDELRALSASKLVDEAYTQHHMTVDGYVLEKTPYESYLEGEYNETAILHGYNLHEGEAFILFSQANLKNYESKVEEYFKDLSGEVYEVYPKTTDEEVRANWEEIYSAVFFDYPHYCLNRLAVKNNIPVYQYYFTKANGRLGPWHSGEEVYFYGNIPSGSKLYDDLDRQLSDVMQGYFLNFIKTGNPNGEGLPEWKQNLNSSDVMELGENIGMIAERKHDFFAIMDKMQGWELK